MRSDSLTKEHGICCLAGTVSVQLNMLKHVLRQRLGLVCYDTCMANCQHCIDKRFLPRMQISGNGTWARHTGIKSVVATWQIFRFKTQSAPASGALISTLTCLLGSSAFIIWSSNHCAHTGGRQCHAKLSAAKDIFVISAAYTDTETVDAMQLCRDVTTIAVTIHTQAMKDLGQLIARQLMSEMVLLGVTPLYARLQDPGSSVGQSEQPATAMAAQMSCWDCGNIDSQCQCP